MLLLDGAYGTLLAPALRGGEVVDELCVREPALVVAAHRDYLEAGAGGVQSNSFLAWRFAERRRRSIYLQALACAREPASAHGARVTATIGPAGSDPRHFYRDLELLLEQEVEHVVCETVTDLDTANAFVQAWEEVAPGAPATATLSLSVSPSLVGTSWLGRIDLYTGDDPAERGAGRGLGLGLNCCEGPAGLDEAAARIAEHGRPWQLVPSAGLPDEHGAHPLGAEAWAEQVAELATRIRGRAADAGEPQLLVAVGGCCGTTPAHVAALRDALAGLVA